MEHPFGSVKHVLAREEMRAIFRLFSMARRERKARRRLFDYNEFWVFLRTGLGIILIMFTAAWLVWLLTLILQVD